MKLSDQKLRGLTVIGSDGLAIGEITALLLDTDAWRVETVQVKLRREIADRLGADRSFFQAGAIDIPIRMVQSVGDAVLLSVPVEQLRQLLPAAVGARAGPLIGRRGPPRLGDWIAALLRTP